MPTSSSTDGPVYVGDVPALTERVEQMLADAAHQALVEYPLDDAFVYQEALPLLRMLAHGERRGKWRRFAGIPAAGTDALRVRAWVASYRSNWRRRHKLPDADGKHPVRGQYVGGYPDELLARGSQMVRDGWSFRQAAMELGVDREVLARGIRRWRRLHDGEA